MMLKKCVICTQKFCTKEKISMKNRDIDNRKNMLLPKRPNNAVTCSKKCSMMLQHTRYKI